MANFGITEVSQPSVWGIPGLNPRAAYGQEVIPEDDNEKTHDSQNVYSSGKKGKAATSSQDSSPLL